MFARLRRPTRPDREETLGLDDQLPTFDAVVRRHVVVDAPPAESYEAMLTADLTESGPLVSLLNGVRFLPAWIRAVSRGETPPRTDARLTLGDLPTAGVWVRLSETAGREFVFGAIGRVWKPDIDWAAIEADDFRDFDRPGYAKIAAGLSIRPYGAGRSLITYEARTAGTDAAATRKFHRYWTIVVPFAGYVMARALATITAVAEAAD